MTPLLFYQHAYRAITDFGFYRQVLVQPLSRTLSFLAYLCLHAALVSTLTIALYELPWISRGLEWAGRNFPTLVFTEGRLSLPEVDPARPLVLEYMGQSVWTYVFDPEGTQKEQQVPQPAVVLTPDKCFLIVDTRTQMSWAWRDVVVTTTVGREDWRTLETGMHRVVLPFSFVAFLLLFLATKTFQAALLTLVSSVSAARRGARLPLGFHFGICIYALTPAVAIDLVLQLTNLLSFMDFLPIYLATAALYAYRATQHCVEPAS